MLITIPATWSRHLPQKLHGTRDSCWGPAYSPATCVITGFTGAVQAWPVSKRLTLPSAMVKAHVVRISPQVSLR